MDYTLFEAQNFNDWDMLLIMDKNSTTIHGCYLGDYTALDGSFLFLNTGINQRERINVADMQSIEKVK